MPDLLPWNETDERILRRQQDWEKSTLGKPYDLKGRVLKVEDVSLGKGESATKLVVDSDRGQVEVQYQGCIPDSLYDCGLSGPLRGQQVRVRYFPIVGSNLSIWKPEVLIFFAPPLHTHNRLYLPKGVNTSYYDSPEYNERYNAYLRE